MDRLDPFRERVETLEQQTAQLWQQTHRIGRRLRWWRGLACSLVVLAVLAWALPSSTAQEENSERGLRGLAHRVAALEKLLKHFKRDGNEVIITGANLHIVNGLGSTDCTGAQGEESPDCPNGLGNLIVGYNEPRQAEFGETIRTGSHNVVVGMWHNFSRFGGLVIGRLNTISGNFAVSGGQQNTASGFGATVSGGNVNTASGDFSTVSGGAGNSASSHTATVSGGNSNTASGQSSAVSGGNSNTASSFAATVSGGDLNIASGDKSWVGGGVSNRTIGEFAAVCGGRDNTANGNFTSVSGGLENTASGDFAVVSGGIRNTASGGGSSVSGGFENTADGGEASVSGGQGNTASGLFSSVSGGFNRTAPGENDWTAGSIFADE